MLPAMARWWTSVPERHRRAALLAQLLLLLLPLPASATDFKLGEVFGLLDIRLSYGLLARVEDRSDDLVAQSAGGDASSADQDDGNQNYDRGVTANLVRGSADLTLSWRNFGAFVRGFAFYDFENSLNDRERTALSNNADGDTSAGFELRDHYLSARIDVFGMPVQLRVGDQVLNWGETTFLRDSVDIINPVDFTQLFQPGSEPRDAFRPLGMVWGVVTLTEIVSIEGFYQYEWRDVKAPPIGTYLSVSDAAGADGPGFFTLGAGSISDLGTDLDSRYGLAPGTLGFDRDFSKLPGLGRNPPKNGEQFGFTVSAIVPQWNATKFGLHYLRHHSRLPLTSGRTGSQDAIDATTDQDVQDLAAALGITDEQAEEFLTSEYAKTAGYELDYPEDVHLVGFSFNTAIPATGTLLAGETSHRFNTPIQRNIGTVIRETLSPIQFNTDPAVAGADSRIRGYERRHKTQTTLNVTQLFGPQLGASSTALAIDVAWSWVHDPPKDNPNADVDAHSVGYRITGSMTYDNVFGGISVSPFVVFSHDVRGNTPGPAGAFLENRKAIVAGLGLVYLNAYTANLAYTGFMGGGTRNQVKDRDFVRFSVAYSF